MSDTTSNDIARLFDPPSPGAQTIEDLRELVAEIQGTEDSADKPEMADDAARLAGRLLADLDELAASLPRGEWGANELGTLANWLGEHGYDIGGEDGPEPDEDGERSMWVYLDRERRPMTETALCGVHEADRKAYAEMSDQRLNVHDWNGEPRTAIDGADFPCTVCGYTQPAIVAGTGQETGQ